MGRRTARALAGGLALAAAAAALQAQTHKVEAAPQNVVRAVGVYEWTGDLAKPTASRLIPISLYINNRLQDAGVYMARPVPFSLLTGNVYELEKSGVPLGTLELAYARHLIANQNSATTFDDGWFGYGKFVPPAAPKKSTLRASTTPIRLDGLDEDDDKPHFSSRSAQPGSGGAAIPKPGSAPAASSPADDPDRPTMTKRSGSDSASATVPGDDADRPTLRKRGSNDKPMSDEGRVEKVGSAADDPNRPVLHRGKPVGAMSDDDIPKLTGLPPEKELHQTIAVSDPVDRAPHDFARAWDDDQERAGVLAKMQAAAREQLQAYGGAPATTTPAPAVKSGPKDPRRINSKLRRTTVDVPPAPAVELLDEDLRGFELSYNGTPTFVYSAHTPGTGAARKDVTLVAQMSAQGDPDFAIKSVTDEGHLDQTPRMHLVDAVDAEASNRASLLFELKAQSTRQFTLYRVIGARAEQIFTTGTTQ